MTQKVENITRPHSPLKAAICKFKEKGISIKKESNNPFFKSKYADLPTILDAIEVEAARCGLTIISKTKAQGDDWVVETVLSCSESDEAEVSVFPVFGNKPQEIGSSITYARRYNIQSLLNLAADDDDGNEANKAEPVKRQPASEAKAFFSAYYADLAAASDTDSLEIVIMTNKDKVEKMLATYPSDTRATFEPQLRAKEKAARENLKTLGK